MTIAPRCVIQLFVTEEEADIIQSALRTYVGPYGPSDNLTLTSREQERARRMVNLAQIMSDKINQEFLNRLNEQSTNL